jgi:hypothetical protein
MAKGNGTSSRQAQLELESEPAVDNPQNPPQNPNQVVMELGLGPEGSWKKTANGKKAVLTAAEWRQELARLFARAPAP